MRYGKCGTKLVAKATQVWAFLLISNIVGLDRPKSKVQLTLKLIQIYSRNTANLLTLEVSHLLGQVQCLKKSHSSQNFVLLMRVKQRMKERERKQGVQREWQSEDSSKKKSNILEIGSKNAGNAMNISTSSSFSTISTSADLARLLIFLPKATKDQALPSLRRTWWPKARKVISK